MSEDAFGLSGEPRKYTLPWWYLAGLKGGIGYGLISIITLPFVNAFWIGELPVLALVQVPKLLPALWVRKQVVMPLIRELGYSKGSFSPDYLMARPYALGLTCSVPLILLGLGLLLPGCGTSRHRRALILLGAVMVADFIGMCFLANRHAVSMY